MKKRVAATVLFFLLCGYAAFAQTVAVVDFTTTQEDIKGLMTGATDVFRSALNANSVIQLTTRSEGADYVISGTVTRFGAAERVTVAEATEATEATGGGSVSSVINEAFRLFDFISLPGPLGQIRQMGQLGQIASQVMGGGEQAQEAARDEKRVVVSAQMVEARTGRLAASGTIQAVTWEDYLSKAGELAAVFINRLPFPEDIFAGTWEAVLDIGNYEDTYRLTFMRGGAVSATVTSIDPSNKATTQSAEGSYSYAEDIFSVNVRFRGNAVAHVQRIDWRTVISLAPDRRSFNAVIPVSSVSGADRVRVVFRKQ